jgi:hypothetical protein
MYLYRFLNEISNPLLGRFYQYEKWVYILMSNLENVERKNVSFQIANIKCWQEPEKTPQGTGAQVLVDGKGR